MACVPGLLGAPGRRTPPARLLDAGRARDGGRDRRWRPWLSRSSSSSAPVRPGVRCAETLARAGLTPILIDEAERPGGQIYRQPPARRRACRQASTASKRRRPKRSTAPSASSGDRIDYRPRTLVWNVFEAAARPARRPTASASSASTASCSRPAPWTASLPFPGWTLPGVFTLGGAQIALKSQGVAIGRRVALVGAGPLLPLVIHQYAKAGVKVVAALDATPFGAKLAQMRRPPGFDRDARERRLVHRPQSPARARRPLRRFASFRVEGAGRVEAICLARGLRRGAPRRVRRGRRVVRLARRSAARRPRRLPLRFRSRRAAVAARAQRRRAIERSRHLPRRRRRRHRRRRRRRAAGQADRPRRPRRPRPRRRSTRSRAPRSRARPPRAAFAARSTPPIRIPATCSTRSATTRSSAAAKASRAGALRQAARDKGAHELESRSRR